MHRVARRSVNFGSLSKKRDSFHLSVSRCVFLQQKHRLNYYLFKDKLDVYCTKGHLLYGTIIVARHVIYGTTW